MLKNIKVIHMIPLMIKSLMEVHLSSGVRFLKILNGSIKLMFGLDSSRLIYP